MSGHASTHTDDGHIGPHGDGDHGDMHEHDDHGHAADALGPIDIAAWGAGILGIVLGLVVAACMAMSTGLIAT